MIQPAEVILLGNVKPETCLFLLDWAASFCRVQKGLNPPTTGYGCF